MIIDRSSRTVVDSRYTVDFEYESNEPTGRLLVRTIDVETHDVRETDLNLDPWSAKGYVVSAWRRASSIFIGGADRIVLLSLDDAAVQCSILYEYEEYETLDEPRIVMADDICIVASETRVTCVDRRNAIRWCWSVRMPPLSEWAQIAAAPIIAGDVVRVPIRTRTKDREISIALVDGARR